MITKQRIKSETDKALELCDYKCVVCGWGIRNHEKQPLVQGAHVKPFEDIDSDTYKDIVSLCPNCHVELDGYLYFFSHDGKYKICINENGIEEKIKLFKDISYIKKEYLAYREYIFKKENKRL